jgi:lipopolysaccharide export system protein LptA
MNFALRATRAGRASHLLCALTVLFPLLPFHASVQAQLTTGMKINNFTASESYPAPDYKQTRYVVSGAEGRPQADKTVLLTGLKLKTFRVNGDLEMTVDAPECIFNKEAGTAQSAGKLILQSGDGKLRVEGMGFGSQLGQKILIISNDVKAIIVRTNANAAPLVITSRWLEFDAEKRRAVFHDEVRGDDPEFTFSCGTLAVSGAATNESSFEFIEASESLVVTGKTGNRRASADRGIYRRLEETIELIGNAAWDVDGKSGRANRVLGLRKDGSVQAEGNVAMKLPRGAMGAATGLLNSSNAPAQNVGVVDVFADKFHWRSNFITGTGAVRIVDATNGVTFSCDSLEARQPANPSEDETAIAIGNVKVEQKGANVLANRADYSKRAGAIVFTGNPRWKEERIEGSAERVTFKTAAKEVEADKNVAVRITASGKGGSSLAFFPQSATNQTTGTIDITSERLNVTEQRALFLGNVNAKEFPRIDSNRRLHSDMLEVLFHTQSNRLDAITATGNVSFEQGTVGVTNGPASYAKLTCRSLAAKADASGEPAELVASGNVRLEQPGTEARGDQAIYNRKTDILKLIGNPPIVETPQVTYTGAREVEWDNRRRTAIGKGYTIVPKADFLKQAEELQKLPP